MEIRRTTLKLRKSRGPIVVFALALASLLIAATARPQDTGDTAQPEPSAAAGANNPQPSGPSATHLLKYFPYNVKSGDTLSSIARAFGMDTDDLARANHLDADSTLHVGQTLKIPNPFASTTSGLQADVEQLTRAKQEAESKVDALTIRVKSLTKQVGELAAVDKQLESEAGALLLWREAAYAAGVIALFLLGVSAFALFEWWIFRSRFVTVAEMNESLRRLDQKYKMLLAKAELRLQELYGRRRPGLEDEQSEGKIPEEFELERLDEELKQILEASLTNLGGARRRRRRAVLKDVLGSAGTPIEAPSARR